MSDPIDFTDVSARHAMPFLFAGQSQKEFFVNQALAKVDLLLHPSVVREASAPPSSPAEGECWLVGAAATGDWAGQSETIACWQANTWIFAQPVEGMRLFDQSSSQYLTYAGTWVRPSTPTSATGGSTVDSEARAQIDAVIAVLKDAAILG